MTLEHTGLSVEDVMEVRDRSLKEAYEVHDVGYEIIVARLTAHGFHVEDHGDDARHADEVYMGDGPDLAVYDDEDAEDPLAFIEIKTKEDEDWFGRCNLRHYREYVNFSNEIDVPVFIWFALLDSETNVVHRDAFVEVEDMGQLDGSVVDVTESEVVFYDEDAYEVGDSSDESPTETTSNGSRKVDGDLMAVDGGDVVEVRSGDVIVEYIPEVHGNEVIELDSKSFRGFPHFLHRVDA
jgi:hypothetical protein